MSRVFFTADTHFGCARTLAVRKRPFASVEEMDEVLIARWNAAVREDDEVYHLGDFATLEGDNLGAVLDRLSGRIHVLLGNNDAADAIARARRFVSVAEMRELTLEGQRIFLCHYPMRDWPNAWRGAWHLFGHVHGRLDREPLGLSLDVGVDSHGYAPVPFASVARAMAGREHAREASRARALAE
jgi:calcineurin-like phosphoesterase family protein